MDLKQFKEYKAIIEEATRLANLTENYTIHEPPGVRGPCAGWGSVNTIFITTNRSRECMLMVEGAEIRVLQRERGREQGNSISFKVCDIINLAEPGSVLQLGVAIKDLLNFSYWSKSDELG